MINYKRESKTQNSDNWSRIINFSLFPFEFYIIIKIKFGCEFEDGSLFTEERAIDLQKKINLLDPNHKHLSSNIWGDSFKLVISFGRGNKNEY